jgi:hypothetical protein
MYPTQREHFRPKRGNRGTEPELMKSMPSQGTNSNLKSSSIILEQTRLSVPTPSENIRSLTPPLRLYLLTIRKAMEPSLERNMECTSVGGSRSTITQRDTNVFA